MSFFFSSCRRERGWNKIGWGGTYSPMGCSYSGSQVLVKASSPASSAGRSSSKIGSALRTVPLIMALVSRRMVSPNRRVSPRRMVSEVTLLSSSIAGSSAEAVSSAAAVSSTSSSTAGSSTGASGVSSSSIRPSASNTSASSCATSSGSAPNSRIISSKLNSCNSFSSIRNLLT